MPIIYRTNPVVNLVKSEADHGNTNMLVFNVVVC